MAADRLTREAKRQQTRADLLEAATRVFAENGFAATTLDQIAAEAGYTKGAIYSNFQSKEELILEVWEARFESTRDVSAEFSGLLFGGAFDEARDLLDNRADDSGGGGLNLLLLEVWVHAIRNPNFRERFAAQMRSHRERTTESVLELYEHSERGAPKRSADLAKIAQACEIGLDMLMAIEPGTSAGLYVDCLAALLDQSPFTEAPSRADP